MSVALFLLVLIVLIAVHELGHFLAAKLFGVRVDEFGVGYPPRAYILGKIGETVYSLNWLPFGGFVRIFGEDRDEVKGSPDAARAMVNQSKWKQAVILVAGVLFNIIFAWVLLTAVYASGTPSSVSEDQVGVIPTQLMVSQVMSASPADAAGFASGDEITAMASGGDTLATFTPTAAALFVQEHAGKPIDVTLTRLNVEMPIQTTVTPAHDVITDAPGTPAIGIRMVLVGVEPKTFFGACKESASAVAYTFWSILGGLGALVAHALTGTADWTNVAGPIGIAEMAGDASSVGWLYFLQFTALISINLAVINLIPIPALDGGRLLFVAIESVLRRPLPVRVSGTLNFIGFSLVILLMLVVTYHDVLRLIA